MRNHIKLILTKAIKWSQQNKLLALLLVVFIVLRFINLYSHATFLGDQGRDAIIIKKIITLEHFPAIGAPTSIGMVYLGPFYYYFMAPWLLLFNFNPFGLAFGVTFLSLIFGLLAFKLVEKLFNQLTAFFFLLLLIFSASNISLSRFSWNPNLLPIFTFFTLFAYYRLLTAKKSNKMWLNLGYSIIFGALFSFSFQLHYLAAFLLPTLAVFFLWQIIKTRNFKLLLERLITAILSFCFFSLPLLIFDLRHNFLNTTNFIKLFTENSVAGISSFWIRLGETAVNFWLHTWQINLSNFWALSLTGLLIIVLVKFGSKTSNLFYWLNLINIVFFILGFSLMSSGRFEHYYGPIYYSYFLALAFLFAFRFQNCRICRIIIPIFFVIYLLTNFTKFKIIFTPGGNQIKHSQRVAAFLETKINKAPFNLATWPVQFTEDNYLYFLELNGNYVAQRQNIEITNQLFVLCNQEPCLIINSPSWNISMFGKAKIVKMWNIEGIKVYKLIHAKK